MVQTHWMASAKTGVWVNGVERARAAEKQVVPRHREIDARAGHDHAVAAAEGRDHDRDGHELRRDRAEHDGDDGGGDAIFGRGLDLRQREHRQIDEVAGDIEDRDDAHAEAERERQVAFRIADFAGGEGDVVPGVGGEERADHGRADERDGGPAPARHSRQKS